MVDFLQQIVSGIGSGSVYALLALGFVLVYKATGVISFVHGDLMMLGGFVGYTAIMMAGAPFFVGLLIVLLVMAVVGMITNRLIIRPLIGRPIFATLLVTMGAGLVLRGIVMMVPAWSTESYRLITPLHGEIWRVGPLVFNAEAVLAMIVTVLVIFAFFLFFQYTRLGTAMRATAQNQTAATYVGINVKTIYSLIWAISAAIAGLAGVLLAPMLFINVGVGFLGLKALSAAIIGGLSSLPGAILGGVLVGIVEQLCGFYLPDGSKDIASSVMLLAVLFLRPTGLFARVSARSI